jgi:hypothetical protein
MKIVTDKSEISVKYVIFKICLKRGVYGTFLDYLKKLFLLTAFNFCNS